MLLLAFCLDCINGKYLWALPTPTTFEKVDQTFIIAFPIYSAKPLFTNADIQNRTQKAKKIKTTAKMQQSLKNMTVSVSRVLS